MKKIWIFFTSIKLTIYLGFIFIIITCIGSFYIQNNPEFFAEIDINILRTWLTNNTMKDFSKAWWIWAIILILLFLAINTLICSIEKIISINNFLQKPSIEVTPEFINSLQCNVSFNIGKDYDPKQIAKIFKNNNYRTFIKELQDGNVVIYGDKCGWSKYAPYVTHLAFLLVLIGHLISGSFGFKISGIPLFAGQAANIPGTNITARLNNLNFEYTQAQDRIKNYSANISIFDNEKEMIYNDIKINHPIMYKDNFIFYVLTYGYYQDRFPYIVINVNQDHGASTVLIASLLMLIGLYITLFITYRRFWVHISPSPEGQEYNIKFAGWADNVNFELNKKLKKFTDEIRKG
ncbi:cytochrome c biogenesis protein ResB [Candidatus Poribacteria bacterium]|nr:cytochrome c biogenesis protein ResB [Candidatus Poribacteria bacterium]